MDQDPRRRSWTSLLPGDIITLLDSGNRVCDGFVDDRTDDGTVIWVVDVIGGRRLFHIDDGVDFEVSGSVYDRTL
nr:hypothetical protein [Arthrobacter sp. IN13]